MTSTEHLHISIIFENFLLCTTICTSGSASVSQSAKCRALFNIILHKVQNVVSFIAVIFFEKVPQNQTVFSCFILVEIIRDIKLSPSSCSTNLAYPSVI